MRGALALSALGAAALGALPAGAAVPGQDLTPLLLHEGGLEARAGLASARCWPRPQRSQASLREAVDVPSQAVTGAELRTQSGVSLLTVFILTTLMACASGCAS